MSDTVEEAVVRAIADDLEANAGLPPHTMVKFRRPRAVLPEDCPLLCVWWEAKNPDFTTTVLFDFQLTIGVSWQEESVEEAKTLVNDEYLSLSLMTNIKRCEARIRELSRDGWDVPNAWQILPAGTEYQRLTDGLVEGYAMAILVNTEER